ncbi:MAG: Holliday junction resolvase RuvX [Alphaproteobacteria bacterium]
MPILNLDDFKNTAGDDSSLLALDVGTKTIGLAVSSGLRISASSLETIFRKKLKLDAEIIFKYYNEYECSGLIVGWPLEMDGTAGRRCQGVRDFTLALLNIYDAPVLFVDERMSSAEAEQYMIETLDMSRQKRKKNIDKMAAQIILTNALILLKRSDI